MGYAFMKIKKLKTEKAVIDAYKHNERIFHVLNADPARAHLNRDIVPLQGETYLESYNRTVADLKESGALTRKIRSDAVFGFEVLMTFSKEDIGRISLDDWVKDNVEWLERTFNPPGRKIKYVDTSGKEVEKEIESNVRAVKLHLDEDVPHLHAFIVPVDEKGHLNATRYVKDRRSLIGMQNTYAKQMARHGLKRGVKHSIATPEERSTYYAKMRKPLLAELPYPEKGEDIQHYRERMNDIYRTELVHMRDKEVKLRKWQVEAMSKAETIKRDGLLLEEQAREKEAKLHEKYAKIEEEGKKLSYVLGEEEFSPKTLQLARKAIKEEQKLQDAIANYPDQAKADYYRSLETEFLEWQRREQEKEKKEKKEWIPTR